MYFLNLNDILEGIFMKTCNFCGASVPDEENVCPICKRSLEFDVEDIKKNKLMAVLSYFGPLVFIPIISAPKSKYARFHANQGLCLLILDAIYYVINTLSGFIKVTQRSSWGFTYKVTPWYVSILVLAIGVFVSVLAIIGIVNAATGKAKKLPLIGNFKILKDKEENKMD